MSAVRNQVPPPSDPIARPRRPQFKPGEDPQEGTLTDAWNDWFGHQTDLTGKFPAKVAEVDLRDQTAAIASTDMTGGLLSAGLYRLSYWLGITSVSGGGPINLSVSHTYRGLSFPIPAPATVDSAVDPSAVATGVVLIPLDALAPVSYAVTYAAGDTYDLRMTLEEMNA